MLSTDDFSTDAYRPHGRVESRVMGRIFVQYAKGPFNEEIIDAMRTVHENVLSELKCSGPWGAIFLIEENAMSSFPMLKQLTAYLSDQKNTGRASVGTAIVIGNTVEGGAMMAPLYVKAWIDAGIPCKLFKSLQEGSQWIDDLLLQVH